MRMHAFVHSYSGSNSHRSMQHVCIELLHKGPCLSAGNSGLYMADQSFIKQDVHICNLIVGDSVKDTQTCKNMYTSQFFWLLFAIAFDLQHHCRASSAFASMKEPLNTF